jgi:hypothetical protein
MFALADRVNAMSKIAIKGIVYERTAVDGPTPGVYNQKRHAK